MLAESIAVITAANAAIGQVKTMIGHGREIGSMGKQLGAILNAEETLKAQGDVKKKSLFSRAMGKDTDSFEEFLELDRIREARQEIESMMRLYGRPGLYDDWVRYQVEERKRKKEQAVERAKARQKIVEALQIGVVAFITVGFAIGLLYFAYTYRNGA